MDGIAVIVVLLTKYIDKILPIFFLQFVSTKGFTHLSSLGCIP